MYGTRSDSEKWVLIPDNNGGERSLPVTPSVSNVLDGFTCVDYLPARSEVSESTE